MVEGGACARGLHPNPLAQCCVGERELFRHPVAWAEPRSRSGATEAMVRAPILVLVILVIVELQGLVL